MNQQQTTILAACALIEVGEYAEGTMMLISALRQYNPENPLDPRKDPLLNEAYCRAIGPDLPPGYALDTNPYAKWVFSEEGAALIDATHKKFHDDPSKPQTP